jgi:hypothetical protein
VRSNVAALTISDLAHALGGAKRTATGYKCRCPVHEDHDPSLDIRAGDKQPIIFTCRVCGSDPKAQQRIVDAIKARGLWADRPERRRQERIARRKTAEPAFRTILPALTNVVPVPPRLNGRAPSAFWKYRTSDGALLGIVYRFEPIEQGGRKEFRPQTFCEGDDGSRSWRLRQFDSPRPLYGLDKLATHPEAPVLVVFGEKCADRGQQHLPLPDYVTVTFPGGEGCVRHADWSPLKGRNVIVWPDHDEKGYATAKDVARVLLPIVASLRQVQPEPIWPAKFDVADLDDAAQVRGLVEAALPVEQSKPELVYEPARVASVQRELRTVPRPVIRLVPGQLPWIVDEAEEVLLRDYAKWGIYQRGDFLVRAVEATVDDDPREYVRRPPGAVILRTATSYMLQDVFGRAICWERGEGKRAHAVDCPVQIPTQYLSRAGQWRLPVLVGVVEAPVMREDGSLLITPGYDERTGLLLQSSIAWRPPASLSDEAVAAAVKCLKAPFAQFPLSPAGLSVVISGILTGLQRRRLFSAPIHAFNAPVQGAGKTLLADCIALVVNGRRVVSISANVKDAEEFRKKLITICIAGDLVVSFDNITRPLENDTLATITTVPTHTDRFMGGMSKVEVVTNILFLATGNNLEFQGDMPSRVIVAYIQPDCERPEERSFEIDDLRAHVLEHREELVTAALTIMQAYHFRKNEGPAIKPFGRFEQWSREIREAMIWAGLADPCETREEVIEANPERDADLVVFENWHRAFGAREITLQELINAAVGVEGKYGDVDLKTAFSEIAADLKRPEQINSRRLAWWCRNRVGRVIGGYKLLRSGKAHAGFMAWRVARVEAKSEPKRED